MTQPSVRFSELLNKLNQAQRQAVETIEGPVMVMAGPGTGKTQVLAARIGQILQETDTQPNQILALTFTESAATTMRRRLVAMIGRAGYYVKIMTFHAFCSSVIQEHPDFFPIDRESAPLSDIERYDIFEQLLLTTNELRALRPLNRPLFYLRDVMKTISDLKREAITPAAFAELIEAERSLFEQERETLTKREADSKEKLLARQTELQLVYGLYETALRTQKRYDFDDMIGFVLVAFEEHDELLLEYQEQLQYFLVDEYQDTNAAQNQVVSLLASHWGEQANIFVVGDPNQAIYRFQGASVENVLGFIDRYPAATQITLTQGYRCPQPIYDAAATVIAHNELTASTQAFALLQEPLQAVNTSVSDADDAGLVIAVEAVSSQTAEIWSVVGEIETLIKRGVSPAEIAILYRKNSEAADWQAALSSRSIPYDIEGGDDILMMESTRQLITFLEVIVSLRPDRPAQYNEDPEALFEVLCYDWIAVPNVLVYQAARAASQRRMSLQSWCDEQIASKSMEHSLTELTAQTELNIQDSNVGNTLQEDQSYDQLLAVYTMLRDFGQKDYTATLLTTLNDLLEETAYFDWVATQSEKVTLILALQSLMALAKQLATRSNYKLADFLHHLKTMMSHGIALPMEDFKIASQSVTLATVHKAKGREWQYVFIVHCIDTVWGNSKKKDLLKLPAGVLKNTDLSKKEINEDDRRLFFVALTRASKQVKISYPLAKLKQGRMVETIPSMFIHELGAGVTSITDQSNEAVIANDAVTLPSEASLAQLFLLPKDTRLASQERAFFEHRVATFSLSITALNTYIKSPHDFVTEVLLRVPRQRVAHFGFGTAVHSTLERIFRAVQAQQPIPDQAQIESHFRSVMERELFGFSDLEQRIENGLAAITAYLEASNPHLVRPFVLERTFGTATAPVLLDDIQLTGRVDRIDWLDEAEGLVRVVDYKTGTPKSVNYIEGAVPSMELSDREKALPEPIRGPYKRQLLFYKLLTELDRGFQPKVTHGSFEFVEPNASGKIVTRLFELDDADVNLLKELIKTVMTEIRALQFLA